MVLTCPGGWGACIEASVPWVGVEGGSSRVSMIMSSEGGEEGSPVVEISDRSFIWGVRGRGEGVVGRLPGGEGSFDWGAFSKEGGKNWGPPPGW